MQIAHQQISGNQPTAKVHGDNKHGHNHPAEGQIFPRKGIAREHGTEHAQAGAAQCVEYGVHIGGQQAFVAENPFISHCSKALGEKQHLSAVHILRI